MTMIQRSLLAVSTCALMSAVPLAAASMRGNWPPESLSGNIASVDPDRNLVVVQTPDGTPFDMCVTAKTIIKSGDQTITLKDLTRDVNQGVSVKFIPERRGDVAKSIRLNG
jgi:hypothetical protein